MLASITEQRVATDTILLERAILHTLSYADVFDYPLTFSEIDRYLTGQHATAWELTQALDEMAAGGRILRVGEFFTLPGRDANIGTRQRRAEVAVKLWLKAMRYARLIASLPFTRMVAITGSLSMSNTDAGTDIDLMLVSSRHRLWTSRALVLLVGRLARLEGVNLCPNYMVTTNALEFHERSLYVAHEVAQMIPLSGLDVYSEIRRLNAWTDDYLPNAQGAPRSFGTARRSQRLQRWLEAALSVLPIAWFESWEMKRKIRKLSRQQSGSPEAHFSADVCKGHVDRHGQQVELQLQERLRGWGAL